MSISEQNCKWTFAQSFGGQDIGPNDALVEFFKKVPYESLVRESIQNSIDARLDISKPVRVSFKFKNMPAISHVNFLAIREHIKGCVDMFDSEDSHRRFDPMLNYIDELKRNPSNRVQYLSVEDFNTKGMNYIPGDTSCGFYSFVKCAGNSSKSDTSAGGSFGFGKAAYFNVSLLRTLLVSTMTDKGLVFYQGVSSLCSHIINGKKYVPVGFYDDTEGQDPISSLERIPLRYRREEPGTSIFIMGTSAQSPSGKADCYDAMVRSAITHFWLAILEGDLEVVVDDVEIVKNNLVDIVSRYFTEVEDGKRGHSNPKPYIDAVFNAGMDAKHVYKELQVDHIGSVRLYLLKSKNAKDRILRMRARKMLVTARPNQTSYGFYAVMVCDNPVGNKLLRMCENPSHTEWDPNNCISSEKKTAREALHSLNEEIQNAIHDIFAGNQGETLNIKGLEEYLYIPTAEENDFDSDSQSYSALSGKPTGDYIEDGSSPTTEVEKPAIIGSLYQSPSTGSVLIGEKKTASPHDKGNLFTGNTTQSRKTKGGGAPGPKKPSKAMIDDPKGKKGTYAYPIPVKYRTFALINNDTIVHKIIIRSDVNIDNGEIVLLSAGEIEDEAINLSYSSTGVIIDNTITGLSIPKGKYELEVGFSDGMRHAIKLEAYEIK